MSPRRSYRRAGFTLIELIIVVLLISISLGVLAGRNYSQQDSLKLRVAARNLYSFLLGARSAAVLGRAENRCVYHRGADSVSDSLRQRQLRLPAAVTMALPASLDDDPPLAQWDVVTYYADGSSTGSAIKLLCGASQLQLHVDPVLGFITIDDHVSTVDEEQQQ